MMRPRRQVGIVGYGGYVPRYRIDAGEVDRVWKSGGMPVGRTFKAVPGLDEDAVTIGIQAARHAVQMAGVAPEKLGAVWFGSESKPYAVKPTSTIIADAIGALPDACAADWEFACKPATEAMQAATGLVGSHMVDYAMCGGTDTAQSRPGDILEYNTGAGGAAVVMGPGDDSLAVLDACTSYVTNTPDFFRREGQSYPSHGQRFTAKPAYFHHIQRAVTKLFEETGTVSSDYTYGVFHQPNFQFPLKVAAMLGFSREQVEPFVLSARIGNTYSGAVLLGLAAALDVARPGDRILLASYGSGAGSDALSFTVTDRVFRCRERGVPLATYLNRQRVIDYATYARYSGKYHLG